MGRRAADRRLRADVRAVPRAARRPTRRSCGPGAAEPEDHRRDPPRPRARQVAAAQFWHLHEGHLPALQPRLQLLQQRAGQELIFDRLPATLSLVVGAAIIWLVAGSASGSSRPGAGSLPRPRAHGHRAGARLGAGILARADRAVPVRLGHRQIPDLPGRRQLRRADRRPVRNGSPR